MKKSSKILLALGSIASMSAIPLVAASCDNKKNINEFIKTTDLGEITTKEQSGTPSATEVITAVKAKNEAAKDFKNLKTEDIKKEGEKFTAKVTSSDHKGEVKVTFTA
ncbi:variable surface lipoprotein, partial [Metamycoplasma alkalescens]|uniref:variable surface lipoprotein n=1 Tax=Metamycoplasma alkalescens TaxID=45363 RepID=UPI00126780D5